MKRILFLTLVMIFVQVTDAKSLRGGINFGFFYSSLEPHGEWIEIDYDVYAWRPTRVNFDWQPYTNGRWVWTADGWFWDSYEAFGWATFHYGRWYYDDYYGWLWLPGYEWAPSWVEWRYDNDYIGWAPLHPYAEFRMNVGIHFSITWRSPYKHWHYVSFGHFCNPNVHRYFLNDRNSYRIHSHTKYRTNYAYNNGRILNRGVDRNIVERRSGTKLRTVEIERTNDRSRMGSRSTSNERVRVYNPSSRDVKKYSARKDMKILKSERKSSLNKRNIPEANRRNDGITKREIIRESKPETRSSRSNNNELRKNDRPANKSFTQNNSKKEVHKQKIETRKSSLNKRNIPEANRRNDGIAKRETIRENKPETRSSRSNNYVQKKNDKPVNRSFSPNNSRKEAPKQKINRQSTTEKSNSRSSSKQSVRKEKTKSRSTGRTSNSRSSNSNNSGSGNGESKRSRR